MATSCIIDTESGGLEARHPTIQVAALCIDNETFEAVDEFEAKIKFDPEACDPEALKINSYIPAVWESEAVSLPMARGGLEFFFKQHADLELVGKKSGRPYKTVRLIGHNVSFDTDRLRAMWGAAYTPFCWWYPLDTLQKALWKFSNWTQAAPPDDYKLETLCRYFEIEVPESHDALADCKLVAALLPHLM